MPVRSEHKLSKNAYAKKQMAFLAVSLKSWREASGRTLANVAEQTGVSAPQISNIESGRGAPSFAVLVILCREAGLTVPAVLGE